MLRQPDRFLRKQLTVRGTVTKDIADAGGPNAILLDGLLVIGPQIANDARVGASLEVHGTFHEFHFTEPGAVGRDLGDPHPLEEYDGRPALVTTACQRDRVSADRRDLMSGVVMSALLALVGSLAPANHAHGAAGDQTLDARMVRALNAERIEVRVGGRGRVVRLAGVSALGERGARGRCIRAGARKEIERIVPSGTTVRIRLDPALPAPVGGPIFGRVYAPGRSGEASVNRAVVVTGWGRYSTRQARVLHPGLLVEADRAAREAGNGMWGPAGRLLSTRAVQTRLAELGYLPWDGVDGVMGDRTRHAVIAFKAGRGSCATASSVRTRAGRCGTPSGRGRGRRWSAGSRSTPTGRCCWSSGEAW